MGKAPPSRAGTAPGPQAEPGVITAGLPITANSASRRGARRLLFIYFFVSLSTCMYIRHTLARRARCKGFYPAGTVSLMDNTGYMHPMLLKPALVT